MRSVLTYPRDYYMVSSMELADVMTEREMRAEYSRLRSIAVKRLARLKKNKYTDDNFYRYNAERYIPLADIKNEKHLMQKLSDIANFLESRKSLVTERKKLVTETLRTLHSHGLKFVNRENLNQFGEFMEAFREQHLESLYSSDEAASLFGLTQEKRVRPEEIQKYFKEFLGQQEAISKLGRKSNSKPITASELRRRLRQNENKGNNPSGRQGRRGQTKNNSGNTAGSKKKKR